MLRKFLKNCQKPEGMFGKIVLAAMNHGHAPLSTWVLNSITWNDGASVLDVGCGGGANIVRMFQKYPHCKIDGIDYSLESVKLSRKKMRLDFKNPVKSDREIL